MKIFTIITLFPLMFDGFINSSIIKRAIVKEKLKINIVDLRKYSDDKHHKVDDYQFGGGEGMVIMAPVVVRAINDVKKSNNAAVFLLSPQGQTFSNSMAYEWSKEENYNHILLICGHYEGFDERIKNYVDGEISIGDYVMTGGELASMVVVDAVSRLIPGVINDKSHQNDSFNNSVLDYPVYTKPVIFNGEKVPDVLLSGNHKKINDWRIYHALLNTYLKRPDLLNKANLSLEQLNILSEIKAKYKKK